MWCLSSWLVVLLSGSLILIYINNLNNSIKKQILKFADDTQIFSAIKNDHDILTQLVQNDLNNLLLWVKEW